MDVIFGRHWIYVGVEPDVPEPGDCHDGRYRPRPRSSSSATTTWGCAPSTTSAAIAARASSTTKRRRSATSSAAITTGPTAWTARCCPRRAHGRRISIRSCHGLKPVHRAHRSQGLIFICLAEEPPADFDEMAARMEPYIAPHDVAQHQGRPPDRPHRGRQLEAHDGEQSRMLPLLGQPSRTDGPAVRLRLRLPAGGDGR